VVKTKQSGHQKSASHFRPKRHNADKDMAELGDDTLIEQALAGNEEAFRELYNRYAPQVLGYMRRRMPAKLKKRVSVADLLQETYATAFRRLPDYKGPRETSFRHWLLTIADYKLKEASRHHLDVAKRAAGMEMTRTQRPETHAFGGREPTPSAEAIASETAGALDIAMQALPDDYRTILYLVHEQGYAVADAAGQIDRSVAATRKLYGRAVSKLAEELEKING
jgi:RNA polymerase sigma-70 factor (ECF subfamily)